MDDTDLVERCIDAFWSADVAWTALQSRDRMNQVIYAVADYLADNGQHDAAALIECHTSKFRSKPEAQFPQSSQS